MKRLAVCRRGVLQALLGLLLAGCGGGSGDVAAPTTPPPQLPPLGAGEVAYDDPATYSTAAAAALPGATEAAALTQHTLTLNGRSIAYTAQAGHLIAREPVSGAAEASMFYVAYTADGATAATRPVTFFYNGGPGSASAWLHLGSFGPKRLVTGAPATTAAAPFPLVDNGESLLDISDLVFVDAVGTGWSEAITPYVNQSFWGVDSDAAVFRDFIVRWLAANGRSASPRFLYGESYGGPRSAVLARRLQDAGVMLSGVVLQSPALNYNSNCGVLQTGDCGNALPSYAAIGAYHGLSQPPPGDIDAYMAELRDFTASRYGPADAAFLGGAPVPADLPPLLAGYTGIAASLWSAQFNLDPETFRFSLIAGSVAGRYDGRVSAPLGSPLAGGSEPDPSINFITASFASVMASYLRDTLRYSSGSTYVLTSNAITSWDFSHAGQPYPDSVPDLQAALAQNASLRVLAISGYHDLATPFRVTELDLARLGDEPRVQIRDYPGGHMSYLTDSTRQRQKVDLAAFYADALGAPRAQAAAQRTNVHALAAARARPAFDHAGTPPTRREPSVPEAALQVPLRDPWVPPRAHPLTTKASPP
jgi:carboxypeptidase C (cathepsin A)